jgi:hypothetical protein
LEERAVLSCEEAARELSDAIDGELPLLRRLRLRMHLILCRPCAAMEASLRDTVQLLGNLGESSGTDAGNGEPAAGTTKRCD